MATPDVLTPEEAGDVLTDEEAGGALPAARTASRPTRYPGPRMMSDVDLGIESPPDYGKDMLGRQRIEPGPYHTPDGGLRIGGKTRPADPLEADPIAQGVVTSTTLGPLGRAAYARLAPVIGSVPAGVATGGAEAGLGAKSAGADIGPAMIAGMLLGGAGVVGAPASPTAIARNNAQVTKDITRGATKAPAKLANDVRFRSDDLGDVLSELPETRQTVVSKARSNPAAASKSVRTTVRDLTSENDTAFNAIQAQHGGVSLDGMAQRLTHLEDELNRQGHGVAADAAARFRDDLLQRYGANGASGVKLTSEQIRNIRNDIGDIAFPGGGARPGAARAALGDIYDQVNAAIEDVANQTTGIDPAAFKARNRQIATLLPVQRALSARAAADLDRELSLFQRAKEGAGNAATGLNRRLRFGAEQSGGDNTGLMLSPSAAAAQFLLNGGQQ